MSYNDKITGDYEEWLDNSTEVPGMLKFAWHFFENFRQYQSPKFHHDIIREILFCYADIHENRFDRQCGITAFRGSAKTTIDTVLLPVYNICFKGYPSVLKYKGKIYDLTIGEELIIIASKSGPAAVSRIINIRNKLLSNDMLIDRFGVFKPEYHRDEKTLSWKQNVFTVNNGTTVAGLGSRQQTRGLNMDDFRPTLVIADDIYDLENTITPESRKKIEEWFRKELTNTMDDNRGKIIFIGTIVHEDTLPVKIKEAANQQNPQWRHLEIPIMDIEEFNGILANIEYDVSRCKFNMPDSETIMEWQKECKTIAWVDKCNLRFILALFREAVEGRNLDFAYQEYFHILQAPENKKFTQEMFIKKKVQFHRQDNINWVTFYDQGEEKTFNCNIYFGVDLASSEAASADDTVIIILAVIPDGRIIVLNYYAGKMGLRDILYYSGEGQRIDTFRRDKCDIKAEGVIDKTLRLYETYYPEIIAVEGIQEQEKTAREMKRVARDNNVYPKIYSYKPYTEKIERILNILMPHYETYGVIHQEGMTDLEYQLEFLGKARHDDIPDAEHMAVFVSKKPSKIDLDEIKRNKENSRKECVDWITL